MSRLSAVSRISSTFELLKRQGRKALAPFITAGDPSPEETPALMQVLARRGADLIELGVPFSDPMADGPAVQRANERALAQGVSLEGALDMVQAFRRSDSRTPVVLMGYLNPIESFGYPAFAAAAAAAGVDGALIVDMPPEEAMSLNELLRAAQVDQIFLAAPTTTEERAALIAERASGFLYYVAVKGVTGGKAADAAAAREQIEMIRRKSALPVAVGFGIRDAESAALMAECCDAVVIGSALVERIHRARVQQEDVLDSAGAFLAEVRAALDRAA